MQTNKITQNQKGIKRFLVHIKPNLNGKREDEKENIINGNRKWKRRVKLVNMANNNITPQCDINNPYKKIYISPFNFTFSKP